MTTKTKFTKPSQILRYAAEGNSVFEIGMRLDPLANNAIAPMLIQAMGDILAMQLPISIQNSAIRECIRAAAEKFEANNL
jgi:hypothetical protein